jgi:DNA repair protein RadC
MQSQAPAPYLIDPDSAAEDEIIARALEILHRRTFRTGAWFTGPGSVASYLTLQLGQLEHEEFGVLWLTQQHQLTADERMFRGTLTQASVFPREVAKAGLAQNAGAAVFYHNHPSGEPEPSQADIHLTRGLKDALAMFDIRVLDHIIVAGNRTVSLAERGHI